MEIRHFIRWLSFVVSILTSGLLNAGSVSIKTTEPWMDSVIADGVRKIREAEAWRNSNNPLPNKDITGNFYGTSYIIIDAANWAPTLTTGVYYYDRSPSGYYVTPGIAIQDSVNKYNYTYQNHQNYVAYYNIVIHNFPFQLKKDISQVTANEGQCMFAQLQSLGAIDNVDYGDATAKFYTIIHNILVTAQNQFSPWSVVCYGCANMLGQYGNQNLYRASYCAEMVESIGLDTSLAWVRQLHQIPKLLSCPIPNIAPPTLREKNAQVSMAVRNFLECNQYGVCHADANVFTNSYARWLFSRLAGNGVINQQLLMNTCMKLNQLSNEMAWSVLTADYENTYTQYNTQGFTIPYYSNNTLDTISGLVTSIIRAQDQFKNNDQIARDSALYFGRLLYRIPTYMTAIGTTQRAHLLDVITNSTCSDIMGITDASDYTNHCERICKALYTTLPSGEERNFLQQLRSNEIIWDLSYRLDNSTFGFFGNDNYTDFIFTISSYWKIAYPEFAKPANANNINWRVIKWESSFFNSNGAVVPEKATNKIKLYQHARPGATVAADLVETPLDIYDPVTIHVAEGSFIPDLPGVKDITVPAIFLDWLYHKKALDDAATAAHVTVAAIALTTGIGELYEATTLTMQIISALEVAVSASDLILINQSVRQNIIAQFPTPQDGEEFLAAYERITMAINLCVAAKGLITSLDADFANYANKFDAQEQGLKNALGETSAEYTGMKKLRDELASTKSASNLLEQLAPNIRAIHDRLEMAGTSYRIEQDVITYYTIDNVALCKIENGNFSMIANKPNIPPTSKYVTSSYKSHHIGKFDQQGCGFIVVRSWIEGGNPQNITLAPRKFVGLRSEMDDIINRYKTSGNDWTILRDELNLGTNTNLEAEEIYYVTISPGDTRFSYDLPEGNEGGAIPGEWVPGGYTKNGTAEACLIGANNVVHNHDINQLLSNFTGQWEKIR